MSAYTFSDLDISISEKIKKPQNAYSSYSLRKTYTVHLEEDEDGRIVVKCPDIPGVVTDGATKEEAMKNVIEAIQAVVGSEKEFNLIASSRSSV